MRRDDQMEQQEKDIKVTTNADGERELEVIYPPLKEVK